MKNICFLIPNLQTGGSERIVSRLSVELQEKFNVYVAVFDKSNPSYCYGGKLVDLNLPARDSKLGKAVNIFKRIVKLRKFVKKNNIDIVFSFTSAANNTLAFSMANCKKIISSRGFLHLFENHRHYKRLCNLTDGILFNSKAQEEFYKTHYPEDKKKLYTLYNLFDIEEINKKSLMELSSYEKEFFDSHKVITTVSRFCYDKGQWNLLKAFELLKEEVPDAGLVFVGHTGEHEQAVINMAKKSKYKDDILFVGFSDNPFKYVRRSSAYAMCSLNEGFPNSLVEAMSVKTPVVSTDCETGPNEILFEDYNSNYKCDKMTVADYGIITPPFGAEVDFEYNNISNSHIEYKNALKIALTENMELIKESAYNKSVEFDTCNILKSYIELINTLTE